jgi:hypothetical protein
LARKPYKPAKPKDIRKFPKHADLSTADYIKQFDGLNMLQSVQYDNLNVESTPQYDMTLPLVEVFNDE